MSQKILFLLFAIYCTSEMSWRQIFAFSGVAVAGFLYLIYVQQEKILYLNETIPPKRTSQNPSPFANPLQQGLHYSEVWITTKDGVKLHAWWIPCDPLRIDHGGKAATIIFYHANAGNMGFRIPNLKELYDHLDVNIFILSYRGYGESEGVPNEEGLKIDAMAGLDYVVNNRSNEVDENKLFLFGRSLGGAVAIYAAAQREKEGGTIGGVIVENTFTCIADMVGKVFPFLDFDFIKQFMLKIHWRSIDLVPRIRAKMLFLASDSDEIVPHQQMLKLYESATSAESTDLYVIKGGMHNDGWMKGGEVYWQKLRRFIHGSSMR